MKQSAEKEDQLLSALSSLDGRMSVQKRDMREKDRLIGEAERCISELKKDNGELEKFKFVLDFQIKQLKRQIEPREVEIEHIKRQIADIDQRLEADHGGNKAVHLHIQQLRQHNDNRMTRINRYDDAQQHSRTSSHRLPSAAHVCHCHCVLCWRRSRDRARCLRRCYSVYRRLLADCMHSQRGVEHVHASLSAILHNKAAFPASLIQLTTGLPVPPSSAAASMAAVDSTAALATSATAVASEFARQRVSLLSRVNELQTELATRWTDSKRANVALMKDNAALIQQMQHIRADIKQHSSKAGYSTHRAAVADSGHSGQRGGSSGQSTDSQRREDELRGLIAQQRARIIALRENIHSAQNRQTGQRVLDQQESTTAALSEPVAVGGTSEARSSTPPVQ